MSDARHGSRLCVSSAPPPAAKPVVAPTGNVKVDAVLDVVNRTAGAWTTTPPAEQGVAGVIAAGIGAGLQTFGAPIEMLDTGFAGLTADLAAMMPGLPAATISPTTMGLTIPHAHAHPPTFGVPAPGLGPLLFGGCQSVSIVGKPAARAGDLGLGITCCGFAPAYECFTGSSSTFIGGSRAARASDIIRQCDPTLALGTLGKVLGGAALAGGVAQAAAAAGGAAMAAAAAAAQAAADAVALAVSATLGKDPGAPMGVGAICNGENTVLIGGMPMPDILSLFGGLLKLVKLGKAATGKLRPRPKARQDHQKCGKPGEPVDPATGHVFGEDEDCLAPAPSLSWTRWYDSRWSDDPRDFGPGYRHVLDKRIEFHRTRCILHDYDGSELEFPCIDAATEHYEGVAGGYRLTKVGPQAFEVHRAARRESMRFECPSPRVKGGQARLVQWIVGDRDVSLTYDRRGRLARVRERIAGEPDSTDLELRRDPEGRIVEVIRARGGGGPSTISRYTYDAQGRLSAHADAFSALSTYGYDRKHRRTKLTNRNGYSFSWTYDARGRCMHTAGDDGLYACTFEYEPGQTTVTKGDGGRWTYGFDRWGTIEASVDPYGGAWRYELDDDGRIVAQIDPSSSRIEWIYDADGGLVGRQDAFGYHLPPQDEDPGYRPRREREPTKTPFGWHVGEQLRRQGSVAQLRVPPSVHPDVHAVWQGCTAANVEPARPTHDAGGRVVEQADASGATERRSHDDEGNTTRRIDRDGAQYLRGYSSWNLCTAEEDPEGRVTRYEFDDERARTKIIDPGGTVTEYPRDQRGRIDRVTRAGRLKESYEYDLADHLTTKRDPHGNVICRYEVGEHGLQTKKVLASGDVIEYAYDRRGRIAEATTSCPDGSRVVVLREHDLAGDVVADTREGIGIVHGRTDAGARQTTVLDRFRTLYHRGETGEWHVRTPDGSTHTFQFNEQGFVVAELASGARELSCFDAENRCVGKVAWRSGTVEPSPARTVRYDYSAEGDLCSIEDSARGVTRYAYDRSHRLVHEVADDGTDETWEYDAAGNIVSHPELGWATYEPGNRLRKVAGEVATYDERDNLIELRRGVEWTRFSYDSLDNVVCVRWSDREEIWTAAYDGLGRRTWKQYGDARTEYYWDDDRLGAERAPDGRIRIYVYTTSDALVPFAFVDYDDAEADPLDGRVYYVFANQIGAPIRIEDEAGEAVWLAERYQAYGALTLAPGSSIECNLRWPGHFYDPETGLHYNRYRYYSPRLGRYIQTDPLGVAGGLNTHAAPANPVATVDVLGLHADQPKAKPADGPANTKTKPDAESAGLLRQLAEEFDRALRTGRIPLESDARLSDGTAMPPGSFKVQYADQVTWFDPQGRIRRVEGVIDPPKEYQKVGVGHLPAPPGYVTGRDHRGHLRSERGAPDQQTANVAENYIAEHGPKSNLSEKKKWENRTNRHAANNPEHDYQSISEPLYADDNAVRPHAVRHLFTEDGVPLDEFDTTIPNPG